MFLCTTGHGYSRAVTVKHQSQLEEKIKVLEEAISDLEADVGRRSVTDSVARMAETPR